MVDIPIDKSRAVRIRARTGEASVPRVFTFTNEDGSPHDISGYGFKLFVQRRSNSNVMLFTLSIGNGLTLQGSNKLLIEVTASQATQKADVYFFRLYSETEGNTWLNGPWEFHNGEFDAVIKDTTIEIKQNGDNVIIQVVGAGGGVIGSITWDRT